MQQYFLVQASEHGSMNIINNNKYVNEDWQIRSKDRDHGKVEVGDFLIVYFTGKAVNFQKQIRNIYEVIDVQRENREFHLKLCKEINPIYLDQIRSNVTQGILDEVFLNCGRQGFNIKIITQIDYEKIIQLSEGLPTSSYIIGAEDLLEEFLVNNWNSKNFFGQKFQDYEILKDDSGELVGQQFPTREIGIIDILCKSVRTSDFLVIELKRGPETSDDVIGQLARYMGWVKMNLAQVNEVYGMVLTSGYDEKLKYALSVIPNTFVATYSLDFEITFLDV